MYLRTACHWSILLLAKSVNIIFIRLDVNINPILVRDLEKNLIHICCCRFYYQIFLTRLAELYYYIHNNKKIELVKKLFNGKHK